MKSSLQLKNQYQDSAPAKFLCAWELFLEINYMFDEAAVKKHIECAQ